MEHKEKGISIGDENMVKCATVRPLIYSVFISQWMYKIAESMLDLVCIYIYIVLWKLEIKPKNQWKVMITNIVRHESGRNIGHEMVVTLKINSRK